MDPSFSIAEAQRDMRHGYLGGAPGMLASALAWLAAGVTAMRGTAGQAVLTLFVGGMLIHPLAVLVSKGLGRPGTHTKGNPLGNLALESTVWMMFGLVLAYGVSLWQPSMFFPAMLLTIGGRYFTFATIFGMRIYWVCGLSLATAGMLLGTRAASMATGAFVGAGIELIFSVLVYAISRDRPSSAFAR